MCDVTVKVVQQSAITQGQLDPSTAFSPSVHASWRNTVQIWNNLYVKDGLSDEETATLTVAPPHGRPFGNVDFRAYNINFENRAVSLPFSDKKQCSHQVLVGQLLHLPSTRDFHRVCQCIILRVRFRKLAGHMVYR